MKRTRYPGVYRRGGRFVAIVSYSEGGKRRQKWVSAQTATAARDARNQLAGQIRKGLRPHRGKQDVSTFLTEWLEEVRSTRRLLTHKNYSSLVGVHVLPHLEGVRLADVDRDVLRGLYRSLPPSTARNVHHLLSSAFTYAVEEGLLAFNPCATVKAPAYKRAEARHLDLSEARRMLDVSRGDRLEAAIILGLVGGLRIAEVCSLGWSDIDGGRVTVRGSWWGETKSGKPRGLTLPDAQVTDLRRARRQQAEYLLSLGIAQDDQTPIVVNAWGQPMVPKRMGEAFAAFCAEHGFNVTFHGLRHSAAILMLSAGVDVRTVAGRLGHSNASITLNTYAHYVRSADEAAAEKMGEALGTP
jgi:integrase